MVGSDLVGCSLNHKESASRDVYDIIWDDAPSPPTRRLFHSARPSRQHPRGFGPFLVARPRRPYRNFVVTVLARQTAVSLLSAHQSVQSQVDVKLFSEERVGEVRLVSRGWVVGWQLFAFIVKHATRAMPRKSRTRSLALLDFSPPVCVIATSPVVCDRREKFKMCRSPTLSVARLPMLETKMSTTHRHEWRINLGCSDTLPAHHHSHRQVPQHLSPTPIAFPISPVRPRHSKFF